MASAKGKRSFSVYILPILFCALLIVLVLVQRPARESDSARVLQASEPLTLTDQAIENYLYAAGFVQQGQVLLDGDGGKAADLIVEKDEAGEISAMTLVFPLPTYYETGNGSDVLASLKAAHDEAAQRGEDMFLALFDAIAATDGRAAARRDGALKSCGRP